MPVKNRDNTKDDKEKTARCCQLNTSGVLGEKAGFVQTSCLVLLLHIESPEPSKTQAITGNFR